MKKYFPILLSKQGELTAIERLEQDVKARLSPIIEVIPEVFEDGWTAKNLKKEADRKKKYEKDGVNVPPKKRESTYENKLQTCLTTHWSFPNNQILIDFTHCSNTNPKHFWSFLNALHNNGVNVVPVISINSNALMINLASTFAHETDTKICIRLPNQFGGFVDDIVINSVVRMTNLEKKDILLIFDSGYIEDSRQSANATTTALSSLSDFDSWAEIIVSAGSFPENLKDPPFAPQAEPHFLNRIEWELWQSIIEEEVYSNRIRYSDYSIRHPKYEDIGFAGTASIKYSDGGKFVIYRGKKSGDDVLGNAQYIVHSKALVNSIYYPGENFSWADGRIMEYSKKSSLPEPAEDGKKTKRPKPGGPKEWVAIGQNHHLTLIDSLLKD